jgi:hypothetical protein
MKRISLFLILAIVSGLLMGAGIAAFDKGGFSMVGWIAASILCILCIFLLLLAWNWAGRIRQVLIIILMAFILRLGLGIVFNVGLPAWGYENDANKAGYLFLDPYRRDSEGWALAKTDRPLLASFAEGFSYDQYGGLLTISASIYRYLTPDDIHRPILILILSAFAGSVGIVFLWKAFEKRWNSRVALIAGLLVAFYPEVVLQGSSQSREPFLVGLICISFWAVLSWEERRWKIIPAFALSLLGLVFISWPVAIASLGFLLIWFWLDHYADGWRTLWKVLTWVVIGLLIAGMLFIGWQWLRLVTKYEATQVQQASGWVQEVVRTVGVGWRLPFLTVYGLTEPLLPATLVVYSQVPAWTIISILRAIGWYMLAPFLLYAMVRVWRIKSSKQRSPMIWMISFLILWLVISSLRAGGDMYDNPRYRVIFMPLLALCAGWAWNWAQERRDPWLWRVFLVELSFVVVFLNWYLLRYHQVGIPLSLFGTIAISIALGILLVLGFWSFDRLRRGRNERKKCH